MNDVRDEALGALLERAAAGIESVPVDRLPDVLRRGSRRHTARFTAIGAAVTVFVGAISWAGLSIRGDGTIPANIADWRTFASLDENGWTIQVPPPWRVQALPSCPNAPERIGVIVTNTDFEFLNPRGESPQCEDRFVFKGFPSDGVAFAFMPVGIRSGIFRQPLDTVLPLAPQLLHRTNGIRGGPSESFLGIWGRRSNLAYVRRWEGPGASPRDVAALDRMLASFRVRGALRWVEKRIVQNGLAITISDPAWTGTTFGGPVAEDVATPIVLLTSPAIGGGSCQPFPDLTLGSFHESGVGVLVADGRTAGFVASPREDPFPPRPDAFRIRDGQERSTRGCGRGVRALSFRFEDAGIPISVTVAATEDVYREQPEMLLHILNSIRVSKV
jgi:hypothetical protein